MRARGGLLALLLLAADPAPAEPPSALDGAAAGLAGTSDRRERLAALGRAAAAQEATLAGLRAELRTLDAERRRLAAALRERGGAAFAALAALDRVRRAPPVALMAHPDGLVAAARAAGVLAEIAPRLDAEAAAAREALEAARAVEARRARVAEAAGGALAALGEARAAIETAAAERPGAAEARLSEAARSLAEAIEAGGPPVAVDDAAFRDAVGALPPPARGRLSAGFGEAGDPAYRRGALLEVAPWAMVYAPALSTVRFAGPVAGAGLVVVLEPAPGALILVGGLAETTARPGDVLPAGAAFGAATGPALAPEALLAEDAVTDSTNSPATLYIETRRDGRPVDPADWFAFTSERTTG